MYGKKQLWVDDLLFSLFQHLGGWLFPGLEMWLWLTLRGLSVRPVKWLLTTKPMPSLAFLISIFQYQIQHLNVLPAEKVDDWPLFSVAFWSSTKRQCTKINRTTHQEAVVCFPLALQVSGTVRVPLKELLPVNVCCGARPASCQA